MPAPENRKKDAGEILQVTFEEVFPGVWWGHPSWWVSISGLRNLNLHVVHQLACFSVSVQFDSFILHVSLAAN